MQAGVSVMAWVLGHQLHDVIGLVMHPALFYAWLYVMTLSPIPAACYYSVLVCVGWYTSGLGYLVRLVVCCVECVCVL